MSVAIAHGSLTSDGGAERVALEMARMFDAPIFATDVDPSFVPGDVDARKIETSRWQSFFYSARFKPRIVYWALKHLYDAQRYSWIEDLYDYDTVIVTKGDVGWWVPHADSQTVIRYFHSPPRRNYDQFQRRGSGVGTRLWATGMRAMKLPQSSYPDLCVFNSEVTQRRGEMYWDIDTKESCVVYPPVPVDQFSPNDRETSDYLLHVGRLAKNKRIDLLVDIAHETDLPVIVAGDGAKRHLVEGGPPNLEYRGYVSEQEKCELLAGARGTLMLAENEDFGITPIESMAAGTPVVGVDEGFTRHQIVDGKNGYLCSPTVDGVLMGISLLHTGTSWNDNQIATFAEQFSAERFREEMRKAVSEARDRSRVNADVALPQEVAADAA